MKQKSKNNISKVDIIRNIALIIGTSTKNIQKITEDTIDVLTQLLKENNKLNIKNFGSFRVIFKKEREGRNPKTNEIHYVKTRNSISFKVSNMLKKDVNEI